MGAKFVQETKFYQIARATPRATEPQKIEKNDKYSHKRGTDCYFSQKISVHDFSISVNIDLTNTLN